MSESANISMFPLPELGLNRPEVVLALLIKFFKFSLIDAKVHWNESCIVSPSADDGLVELPLVVTPACNEEGAVVNS